MFSVTFYIRTFWNPALLIDKDNKELISKIVIKNIQVLHICSCFSLQTERPLPFLHSVCCLKFCASMNSISAPYLLISFSLLCTHLFPLSWVSLVLAAHFQHSVAVWKANTCIKSIKILSCAGIQPRDGCS